MLVIFSPLSSSYSPPFIFVWVSSFPHNMNKCFLFCWYFFLIVVSLFGVFFYLLVLGLTYFRPSSMGDSGFIKG